jgi:CRP-like cAMP-binding protein
MFDELNRTIYERGQQIFKDGDEGDCAYMIEERAVEIFVMDQDKGFRLGLMGKGEMFGEVSLIDYRPRTAPVRAVERTVLIPVTRELVKNLLDRSDPISRHFLLIILDRFRSSRASRAVHWRATNFSFSTSLFAIFLTGVLPALKR